MENFIGTEVLVTYWNEDNDKIKEELIFSSWDKESIIEDSTNWLKGNSNWENQTGGVFNLKEEGGDFDWFEITEIMEYRSVLVGK